MFKPTESVFRVFRKAGLLTLLLYTKLAHVGFVRCCLCAYVIPHQSQVAPEMYFKSAVRSNKFTPRETSTRALALPRNRNLKPFGESTRSRIWTPSKSETFGLITLFKPSVGTLRTASKIAHYEANSWVVGLPETRKIHFTG